MGTRRERNRFNQKVRRFLRSPLKTEWQEEDNPVDPEKKQKVKVVLSGSRNPPQGYEEGMTGPFDPAHLRNERRKTAGSKASK